MSKKDNKRRYERFPLELEAKLVIQDKKGKKTLSSLHTKNVSAGGVLIKTGESLPKGLNLDMTLVLPLDKLDKADTDELNINISGKVIRLEQQGIIIEFDKSFSIIHSGISEESLGKDPKEALTKREKQILDLIASGASNKEISQDLSIGLSTVKSHIYNLYKKIDVTNRFQAMLWQVKNSGN